MRYAVNRASLLLLIFGLQVVFSGNASAQDVRVIQSLGTEFKRKAFQNFPSRECVTRFAFSPDGDEAWCLAGAFGVRRGEERGRAFVFHQKAKSWENIPATEDPAVFNDVAFSADGKTTWIAMSSDRDPNLRVRERRFGTNDWKPFSIRMPAYYSVVENFWLSPNGHELWMYASDCGLVRANLSRNTVTQYVQSDVRQFGNIPHFSLIEDYVVDFLFALDSTVAICAATGGGKQGITKIELRTGNSKDFPAEEATGISHLVMSPDGKSVWCIFENSDLRCFDIVSETWSHHCSSKDGMPIETVDTLVCSPNGKYLWISGSEGLAQYSIETKKWIGFTAEEWRSQFLIPEIARAPLAITSDGKSVICGHTAGLALFDIDGNKDSIIQPAIPSKRVQISMILPIPKTTDFLCAMEFESGGGIFLLDVKSRSLKCIFTVKSAVTAVAFSPSNNLWIATPGFVYETDFLRKCVIHERELNDESADTKK